MVGTNKSTQSTVVDKINYGRSFNILKAANADRYLESLSHEDLLKKKLIGLQKGINSVDEEESKKFLTMMSNVFQSISTLGLTTYEIVQYITSALSTFENPSSSLPNEDNTTRQKLLDLMTNYIAIFHMSYTDSNNSLSKNFDVNQQDVLRRIMYAGEGSNMIDSIYGGPISNRKIESKTGLSINSVPPEYFNTSSFLNFGKGKRSRKLNKLVNNQIDNPTKENPSLSVVLLNNDNLRGGTKNSLELSTFFNLIPTLEYAKAYPYFNATFILPTVSRQDKKSVFRTSTLNQFLFGGDNTQKNENFKSFEGRLFKDEVGLGVKTNLSVFTTPQTIVNMNEKIGHNEILSSDKSRLRITNVHDQTRPFMTLKDFTIDVSPTKGMMSFKTGKLSLILHDRTRMVDIAPFIKPDLFGAFGAEIVVEYGWSHNESQSSKKSATDISNNPIGDFLDSSKCIEKYMIVNSQFTIENNGQVNINLSIAMKGPIDIRQTEIFADSLKAIDINRLNSAVAEYSAAIGDLSEDKQSAYDFNTNVAGLMTNLQQKRKLKPKSKKRIKKILKALEQMLEIWKGWKDSREISTIKNVLHHSSRSRSTFKYTRNKNLDEKSLVFKFLRTRNLETFLPDRDYKIINNDVMPAIERIKNIIDEYLRFDDKIKEEQTNFIEDLIGGTQFHDMFIDNALNSVVEKRKPIAKNTKSSSDFTNTPMITTSSGTGVQRFNFDKYVVDTNHSNEVKLLGTKITHENYVTLGTVISSLISTHMIPTRKYDEIQIIFHTVNEKAGLASVYKNFIDAYFIEKYRLNIASLLIKRSDLKDYLEKLFNDRTRLTLESLISQIVVKFIVTKDNPCYGLSSLYSRDSFDTPVKPKKGTTTKVLSEKLNRIYYRDNKELYESEPQFIPPDIHMTFDALTSRQNKERTICRITVYDRNNNPYQSLADIYNGSFTKSLQSLSKIRQITQDIETKSKKLGKNGVLNKTNDAKKLIASLISGSDAIFEKISGPDGVFYKFKDGFGFNDLKRKYKTIIPSATFATQNTSLISASVATVNEGKLNTVYITRQDRNKTNEVNNQVIVDTPLRILPAQASIETFGCPWINFGQYIFLDFETGTTIDNTYAVTGLKHTISPGKFTTQVTLSYGDVYGKYEGAADAFDSAINKFGISEEDLQKKTEEVKTKTAVTKVNKSKPKKGRLIRKKQTTNTDVFTVKDILFNLTNTSSNKELIASYSLLLENFTIDIVDDQLKTLASLVDYDKFSKSTNVENTLIKINHINSTNNKIVCGSKKIRRQKIVQIDNYLKDSDKSEIEIDILIKSRNPEEFNVHKNKLYSYFLFDEIDYNLNEKSNHVLEIFNKGILLKGKITINQNGKVKTSIRILNKDELTNIKYLSGGFNRVSLSYDYSDTKSIQSSTSNKEYIYRVINPNYFVQNQQKRVDYKVIESDQHWSDLLTQKNQDLSYALYVLNVIKYSRLNDEKRSNTLVFDSVVYDLLKEKRKSRKEDINSIIDQVLDAPKISVMIADSKKFKNIVDNFLYDSSLQSISSPTKVTQTTPDRRPVPQPPAQLPPPTPPTTQITQSTQAGKKEKAIIFMERSSDFSSDNDDVNFLEKLRDRVINTSDSIETYIYNRTYDTYNLFSESKYRQDILSAASKSIRTNISDIVNKCKNASKIDNFVFITNRPLPERHKKLIENIKSLQVKKIIYIYFYGKSHIEGDVNTHKGFEKLHQSYRHDNFNLSFYNISVNVDDEFFDVIRNEMLNYIP